MNAMLTPHQRVTLFSKIIRQIGSCCSVVLFMLMSVSAWAQICVPAFSLHSHPITHVSFGNIENTTDADYPYLGYEDFTNQTSQVILDETYQITLKGNTEGSTFYFYVYIDWNQNGVLDDVGEVYSIGEITNSTGFDDKVISENIDVPLDAALGITRMRVINTTLPVPPSPCFSNFTAQSEDYSINVLSESPWDCFALESNIGDVCDDGDPNTIYDVIGEDCLCAGIEIPAGTVCEDPIEINALPFTASGNLATYGNNYTSGDVPQTHPNAITTGSMSGSYLSGDEVVFAYTPTEDQIVYISTNNADDWISLWVFTGCPFISTYGYHVAPSGITRSINELPLLAGTTYYIVISNWPSVSNLNFTISIGEDVYNCADLEANVGSVCDDGDSGTYDDVIDEDCNCVGIPYECQELEVNIGDPCDGDPANAFNTANENCECVGEPTSIGEVCGNPITISELPYATTDNTGNYGANYGPDDFPGLAEGAIGSPSKFYLTGDDVVYAYTPTEDQTIDISVTEHSTSTGVFVFTGCPFETTVGGFTNSSGTMDLKVEHLPVQAGVTYYIVISTFPAPQSTNYTLNITHFENCEGTPSAGTPDEVAIEVCAGESFSVKVSGVSDPGAGLTNIWQSSPTGENNWTAIEGASAKLLNRFGGIEVDTDYRYVVTCIYSDEADVSDIIQVSINPNIADCICIPGVSYSIEPITYVNFGDIDNTSDASSTVAYEDFTEQSTQLNPGESFEITLKGNTNGIKSNYFTVFIDWNQNGVLDDAGEIYQIGSIHNSSGTDGISVTGNIEVPYDAIAGTARMRIRKFYSYFLMTPCGTFNNGQIEDYTVTITEFDNCSGIPSAGTPEEDALLVCAGKEFTLNVSGASDPSVGLSYIWQSSPFGENEWTAIAGASENSLNLSEGIEVATDYRYVVTCSYSEETDVSDVIQVTVNPDIAECLCIPSIFASVEAITYVNFGDIDNTTDALSSLGYEDFTDQSTPLNPGESFEITVKGNTAGNYTNNFTVFIDWNQNGVFVDAGEIYQIGSIKNSSGTDDKSVTGNIVVPLDALPGNTRMRIQKTLTGTLMDQCDGFNHGQTEDYTVTVIEMEACAATPSAGIPDIDALLVCAGEEFTINVSGVSVLAFGLERIWQSSPADENDWTAIEGAFSKSLSVMEGIEEDTDYRYVVTCIINDETDVSDVIQVSVNTSAVECVCTPSFSTSVYPITSVHLGNIQNTSTYSSNDAYEDFTDQTTQVTRGETYQITSKGYTGGDFTSYFTVFIDWNQNGILDDDGEVYHIGSIKYSNGTDQKITSGDIDVPLGALLGSTRMRVLKTYLAYQTDPCGSYYYGQAEDYTLIVESEPVWDCPDLAANVGDVCDDGDDITENDVIGDDCECAGAIIYDCTELEVNFGDPCDDGNPATTNDVIGEDCLCGSDFLYGKVCETAIVISGIPYTATGNTSTYGNDYGVIDFPSIAPDAMGDFSSLYLRGDDVVYSYTPESDGMIAIIVSNHSGNTGFLVFTGCPFESVVGGHVSPHSAVNLKLEQFPVQAGLTYYVVISTNTLPQSTNYTLTLTESTYDCDDLQVNFGHPCDDGSPLTTMDRINEDCECVGEQGYTEASAIPIYCNTDPITYSSVNSNAMKPMDSYYSDDFSNRGLYFSFIGTGDYVTVSSRTSFTGQAIRLTGDGGEGVSLGGNSIDGNTIAGGIHYVYIAHNSQYSNYVTGDITINIDCGPSPENNNCENATPLTCGSSVEGSTYGANHNELGLVSCMPGYNRRDVFYTLDVLEGMEYTVSVNNENYENALAIYSGICGDLIEIECSTNYLDPSEDNTITFTASANEILIIRTYSYNYYSNYFTIGVSCDNGFDCPDLEANIGDGCDDNDENTENDIINEYCDCLGTALVPPINPFLNLNSLVAFYSYPSPTKGPSKVVFTTGVTTHTLLEVYDLNGRNLGTLFNQDAQEGEEYTIDFNGSTLPNGVYIYRMTTNDEIIIKKFMIAR